jgi:hypothetical protein
LPAAIALEKDWGIARKRSALFVCLIIEFADAGSRMLANQIVGDDRETSLLWRVVRD